MECGPRLLAARGALLHLDERDAQLAEGVAERRGVVAEAVAEGVDDAAHGVDRDGGLVEARGTVRVGSRVSSASVITSSKPMKAKNTSAAAPSTPPTPAPASRSTSPTCGSPISTTMRSPPTWTALRATMSRADCLIPIIAIADTTARRPSAATGASTATK